jgi:hypothetical protein
METVTCLTSGSTAGNPGPATISVQILAESGAVLNEFNQSIGNATDLFAEYYAVMFCLQKLVTEYGESTRDKYFKIKLTIETVQQQLSRSLPLKEPGLVPMFIEIHNMCVENFPQINFDLV